MWVVAGILLGLVVLSVLAGFHVGPHAHAAGAIVGAIAAIWLVGMAIFGNPHPLLFLLLGADVVIGGAVGVLAWRGLKGPAAARDEPATRSVEGAMGVAVSALSPHGVVRVGMEEWSAVSLNGNVAIGDAVQVIKADGVRLEVWGEANEPGELGVGPFSPSSHPQEDEGSDTMMPHHEKE